MLDLKNNVKVKKAFDAAPSSNTTTAGVIIDTLGFRSVTFALLVHAFTDGVYTPLVQHGDTANLSDAAAVDDTHLIGTEAAAAVDADDEITTVGYTGLKRYVRMQVVSTGVTTGASLYGVCILGHPEAAPVTQGVG